MRCGKTTTQPPPPLYTVRVKRQLKNKDREKREREREVARESVCLHARLQAAGSSKGTPTLATDAGHTYARPHGVRCHRVGKGGYHTTGQAGQVYKLASTEPLS